MAMAMAMARATRIAAWRARATRGLAGDSRLPRAHDALRGELVQLEAGRRRQRVVTMYVCGPTVYDAAHLGHARTYVQFDAIRRVMQEQLGWQVAYFMNVTDVDDKILQRAREAGVNWRDLAREQEIAFFQDMAALGVALPTFRPRATEYVDEIVKHIQDLQDRGLAYVGDASGSVYFDTGAFDSGVPAGDLRYGALDPSRRAAASPGPAAAPHLSEKRSARDFALWKRVVDADDATFCSWPSPWGAGRPGWHSECAAMVDRTAGSLRAADEASQLDFHGGGIDLRFPHHENERAQGQGLLDCCSPARAPWSAHFLHTGHLHIAGRKMSKSLKNFVTVRDVLEGRCEHLPRLSARQLRLLFLMVKYNEPMELSADSMRQAAQFDGYLAELYRTVRLHVEACAGAEPRDAPWTQADVEMVQLTHGFRSEACEALEKDFDMPEALGALRRFATALNAYVRGSAKVGVLSDALACITRLLSMLGLEGFGEDTARASATSGAASSSREELVDALVAFRSHVRAALLADDRAAGLRACDAVRDVDLPALGVRLDDRDSDAATWSWAARTSEAAEAPSKAGKEKAAAAAAAKARVPPAEMFLADKGFSAFDEAGVPTHDAQGAELSKNARKKLRNRMVRYAQRYEREAGTS